MKDDLGFARIAGTVGHNGRFTIARGGIMPYEKLPGALALAAMLAVGSAPAQEWKPAQNVDIVVASEVMAILCLATSLEDLKERLGNIVVGYTRDERPVAARDLGAHGAMARRCAYGTSGAATASGFKPLSARSTVKATSYCVTTRSTCCGARSVSSCALS